MNEKGKAGTGTDVSDQDDANIVRAAVEALLDEYPVDTTTTAEFLGAQFDRGLAWVHFEKGHGGLGVNPKLQRIVTEAVRAAGGPFCMPINPIGYGMCGPTIHAWGTVEQKEQYLRPLFTCEEIWCQLFSEPGAGSDVAGLSMRAVEDGDEWVVNGQKVWTTLGHVSRYGLLVTRTDPGVVKHAGLTAFVVDMDQPTVDVRPLRQMTGEAEFNEVYFTDTRVPADNMLGEPGDGWRVSVTTLMNERTSLGGGTRRRGSGTIGDLVQVWSKLDDAQRSPIAKDRVTKLWIRAEVHRLTNMRASQNRKLGEPGPEGSIGKLESANLNKAIYEELMALLGPESMLYGSYEMTRPDTAMSGGPWQQRFLRSRANSIEGGTTEVMLNILGERVLGLPGDVRVDRNVPWSEVPRN